MSKGYKELLWIFNKEKIHQVDTILAFAISECLILKFAKCFK